MVPNFCNPCKFHSHLPHPSEFPKTKTLKPICCQGELFPAPLWVSIPGRAGCPRPGSCSLTPNPPPALMSCVCSPAHSHHRPAGQTNQHIISTNTEGLIECPEPLGLCLRLPASPRSSLPRFNLPPAKFSLKPYLKFIWTGPISHWI